MHTRSLLLLIFGLLIGILLGAGILPPTEGERMVREIKGTLDAGVATIPSKSSDTTIGRVVRVIDGDTVVLNNGEHVRYLGIDTPEIGRNGKPSECFAEEAAEKNSALVLGRDVRLIADKEDRDRYGRLLRFVEVDGINVNIALVEGGYATRVYVPPNNALQETLRDAEASAKVFARGLWSACRR
jgi:micrococcal nuclease